MGVDRIKRLFRWVFYGVPNTTVRVEVKEFQERRLEGKNIIITGGSRGIGYAIAKKCISEGANVLICGRNIDSLNEAKIKLGERCNILQFDVSKSNELQNFIDKSFDLFGGRVDCLVNNAGISYHEGSFRNVTEKGFNDQFEINFKAPYFLAKYFIERVEKGKQTSANVLFITSERGSFCTEIPYGLSKAAVKSYVGSLARNLYGRYNIRVNALAPGVTASDMTGIDVNGDYYSEASPINRVFHPTEMSNVACFLLSDESSCISGETIHCDAGRHQSVIN